MTDETVLDDRPEGPVAPDPDERPGGRGLWLLATVLIAIGGIGLVAALSNGDDSSDSEADQSGETVGSPVADRNGSLLPTVDLPVELASRCAVVGGAVNFTALVEPGSAVVYSLSTPESAADGATFGGSVATGSDRSTESSYDGSLDVPEGIASGEATLTVIAHFPSGSRGESTTQIAIVGSNEVCDA